MSLPCRQVTPVLSSHVPLAGKPGPWCVPAKQGRQPAPAPCQPVAVGAVADLPNRGGTRRRFLQMLANIVGALWASAIRLLGEPSEHERAPRLSAPSQWSARTSVSRGSRPGARLPPLVDHTGIGQRKRPATAKALTLGSAPSSSYDGRCEQGRRRRSGAPLEPRVLSPGRGRRSASSRTDSPRPPSSRCTQTRSAG